VFAVAFDANGGSALASDARTLYRLEDGRWRETRTPSGAAPARALVAGGMAARMYLAGWSGLFRSDDGGRSWSRVAREIGDAPVTALAVSAQRPDEIHALAAGNLWSSTDAARSWRANSVAPPNAQALAFDRTRPSRLWLASAGRLHSQSDRTAPWQPVDSALPDAQAVARGIDVRGDTVVVVTDRGVFRSADAGASWTLLRAELPDHAEAALLLPDPHASATLYAGFSRTGIEALQAVAPAAEPSSAGSDVALAVGAYAGFALLLLGTGLAVHRLTRAKVAAAPPTLDESLGAESPR
jgi:ligand-binding sensor domain-containing protein